MTDYCIRSLDWRETRARSKSNVAMGEEDCHRAVFSVFSQNLLALVSASDQEQECSQVQGAMQCRKAH